MKLSYIFGILLIMATAFSNMAMAQQLPAKWQKYEKDMPESVKKALIKFAANPRRSNSLVATNVQSLRSNSPSQPRTLISGVQDRERILAMFLARKNHANENPAATLARVQRNGSFAQTAMMQARPKTLSVTVEKTDAEKLADTKAAAAQILAKFQSKRTEVRKP